MKDGAFVLPGRIHEEELMDIEDVPEAELARCLRDLARVNVISAGYRPTLHWLDQATIGRDRVSIVDIGCGYGDMLRRVERWGKARGIETDLLGIDLNPKTIRIAQAATDPASTIRWEAVNLFDIPEDHRPDIVISSLFAHHLGDEELVGFVRWLDRNCRVGWFINDLHRHWISAWGLTLIFAFWPVHRFVRNDGPVSVRRAFIREDLRRVAEAAGVPERTLTLRWWFPFRFGFGRITERG
ncbi:methyltransferase domain-containing protein [Maritimibacter sp. UBA3975]|uniref:methyltransferase domain-containing protein n=1 Tax=Maritimibacter sp. UBA3975 TaxID=1946833 RepID=UPI000C0AFBC7|nr:methyltransferase domain-containing protein [Maritimibacter sp. UBA3975]MAM60222.1 hypothetical protein [Maritimibacter sp.]|tara:strand:- start:3417 stop:4139 length:723 start_codon:yes stop_codon:yes gene_type:complete